MKNQHFYQTPVKLVAVIVIVMLALAALPALPASAAACTFTSIVSTGNWATAGSWNRTGSSCSSTYPGSGVSGDIVVITSGDTITLNVSPTYAIASLTITANTSISSSNGMTISSTNTLTVSGAVTMNVPSNQTSTIAVGSGTLNAASISIPGSISNNRDATVSVSTGTVNVTGDITFSGTAAQALLTFTGAGVLNIGGILGAGGTFTPSTGTVNFNGAGAQTIPAYNFYNLSSSSTGGRTLASSGTIGVAGTFIPGTNGYTITGSTVNFNGSSAQTIPAFNFNNLTSSSSGARTLTSSGTIVLAGTFTPGTNSYTITGSTLDFNGAGAQTIPAFNFNNLTSSSTGARTLASSGTIGVAGAFTPGANAYTNTGSTMNFNGSGAQTIPAFNFNNLTSSSTGTRTLASSGTIGVAGTFTSGTNAFTATGSTVNFNRSGAQTVPALSFDNLVFSGSAAKSMVSGTSVTGNLSITGSATASIGTSLNLPVGSLTLGTLGTINSTWGYGPATPPDYKNTTYFSNTTGYLTVGTDTRAAQAPLFVTGPGTVVYGSTPTITTTGGSGSGTLSYSSGSSIGCTVNASTGVISVSNVSGTCTVTAARAGDGNYLAGAASAGFDITLTKATPVITFGTAPAPMYPGPDFTVSATTTNTDSSAISYSYVSGPCSFMSGASFSPTGVGTCVVQADAVATTNFNAAAPVTQGISIVAYTLDATTNAATAVRRTTTTLNGTVNASGGSMIVTFEYGLTTSYGTTVTAPQSPVTGSLDTVVNYQLSGLIPNTTYHYRVVGQGLLTIYGNDLTFTTSPAGSVTFYVDKTNSSCSDSGPGSLAAPFCTISRGATVTDAGDTVHVLNGTYAETVKPSNDGGAGYPITFSAEPGVTVTGAAGNSSTGGAFRITLKNYIVIDGFNITNTADYGIILTYSDHITVSHNQVSNSGSLGATTRDGISLYGTTNSTISNNTTENNTRDGIRLNHASNNNTVSNNISFGNSSHITARDAKGIDLIDSRFNTIIHNITYGNEDSGINLYVNTAPDGSGDNQVIGNLSYTNGDHGIDNNGSPRNVMVGNTVQGNVTSGINLELNSIGSTVLNNIVSDNGINPPDGRKSFNIYADSTSYSGTTIDYNLYYLTSTSNVIYWNTTKYLSLSSFQAGVLQEANGLQANPLFLAPATPAITAALVVSGDYHLLAGSPAIDSANSNATGEPTLDLVGNPRVDDPLVTNTGTGSRTYDDRGAYEYQPPVDQAPLVVVATPGTVVYGFTSTLSTTGGSGTGVVTYDAGTSTGCSLAGNILSVTNASGTCDVTGTKAADYQYNPVTSAPLTVTLQKASQAALTVVADPSTVVYGFTSALSATGGTVSGAVTYDVGASTGCSVTGSTLSVTNASGTCFVTATMAGDANYNPVTSAPLTVTLQKASQAALTVVADPSTVVYGSTSSLTTLGGSGTGLVTYSAGVSTGCSLAGDILSVVDASGSCDVSGTKAADNNYNEVTSAALPVTLQKADQATLTVVATPPTLVYGFTSTLSTSGGSGGGAVTYSVGISTGCSVTGSTLSYIIPFNILNTCNVTATKAADNNYNATTSAPLTVPLQKANQAALTVVADPSTVVYGFTSALSATGGTVSGAVTYDVGASTGCSVTGSTLSVTNASGTCFVTATMAGDANYNPVTSAPLTVTLQKASQAALTVVADPSTVVYGSTSSLSTTGGSGSGTVTYDKGTSTGCSVAGNILSVTNASGTCDVTATKAADNNYNLVVSSAALPVTLQKASQAALMVVADPSTVVYGSTSSLSTTGGSGSGAVTYDKGISTGCSVAGNILSVTNASGSCDVSATKAADNNYNEVTSAALPVKLQKADQATLAVVLTPSPLVWGIQSTLTITGGSGSGAVTYDKGTSTGCSVMVDKLDMTDMGGSCTITATKAADNNYNLATSAPLTVPFQKANQAALVVAADPTTVVYGSTSTLSTTGGSGSGAVTYDKGTSTGCSVAGNILSVTNASGTCSVTATKAGDVNYNPITSTPLTVTLQKAEQAVLIAVSTPPSLVYGFTSTLSTTGGSGSGLVTFSVGSSSVCSVTGSTLSITNFDILNICNVTATKAADNNYNAKTSAVLAVTMEKAPQAALVVVADPSNLVYGSSSALSTSGGSGGGAVTYSVGISTGCSVTGSTLSYITPFNILNTCNVTATKAADAHFLAATSAPLTVPLVKADQPALVVVSAPPTVVYETTSILSTTGGLGTGVVTYDAGASTGCSVAGNILSVIIVSGSCNVTATKAADAYYNAAVSAPLSIPLQKADQALLVVVATPSTVVYGSTSALSSIGGSGPGAVTYDKGTSTGCSLAGNILSVTNASGSCSVTATKAASTNYNAKTSAALPVTLQKKDQILSFTSTAPASAAVGVGSYTPIATSDSALTVALTIDASTSTKCSISAGIVSFNAAGACVIDANQTGNNNYNPAPQVQQSFTIYPSSQTISVSPHAPANKAYLETFTVGATSSAGSSYPVVYTASGVCTNVGTLFTMASGTGTCTVHYNQAGDSNYGAAPEVTENVTATKLAQAITVTTHVPVSAAYNSSFIVGATSNSTLTVEYSASGACTNIAETFTITGVSDTCTVHYNQPGNGNYGAAPEVTESTIVTPAVLSVLRADPTPTYALSVNFTVTFSEPVINVDSTAFSLTATGAITVSVPPLGITVTGSGATYNVAVDTGTGDGTLRLDVKDGTTIQDVDGGHTLSIGFTGGDIYTIDKTAPTVLSSVRADANPTNLASVGFTVTFSEPVVNVGTADFALTPTGATIGYSVTGVTGSGASYYVDVATGTGNGTLRLDVNDGTTIQDLAGNLFTGGYTAGDVYTIDKTIPPPTFSDVPYDYSEAVGGQTFILYPYIQALYNAGYTAGCYTNPLRYCPTRTFRRDESAVFMLRGLKNATYGTPANPLPPAIGTLFDDMNDVNYWGTPWAEQMYLEGLTAGCWPSPLRFCPADILPRVQASVFALRLKYGVNYGTPAQPLPAATGLVFADMTDPAFWGTAWAEKAYADGLLPNCGIQVGGLQNGLPKFCPDSLVNRAWAAYMIVIARGLPLP